METLEELDWCLDQLESMQTHRSVSDMASNNVTILRDFVTYLITAAQRLVLGWCRFLVSKGRRGRLSLILRFFWYLCSISS